MRARPVDILGVVGVGEGWAFVEESKVFQNNFEKKRIACQKNYIVARWFSYQQVFRLVV